MFSHSCFCQWRYKSFLSSSSFKKESTDYYPCLVYKFPDHQTFYQTDYCSWLLSTHLLVCPGLLNKTNIKTTTIINIWQCNVGSYQFNTQFISLSQLKKKPLSHIYYSTMKFFFHISQLGRKLGSNMIQHPWSIKTVLKVTIREGKECYKLKMEQKLQKNNVRQVWKDLNRMWK